MMMMLVMLQRLHQCTLLVAIAQYLSPTALHITSILPSFGVLPPERYTLETDCLPVAYRCAWTCKTVL
jgi:hypothetical protein